MTHKVSPGEDQSRDDDVPWLKEMADETVGLSMDLVAAVQEALESGASDQVRRLVEDVHEADLADLLESLDREDRVQLVTILGKDFDSEALPYLDGTVLEEVTDALGPAELARSLEELDSDDAFEVFEELDDEVQQQILPTLPEANRVVLEESLSFPEESAGRLMQREVVVVPEAWNVGETIDYMRAAEDLPDDFYDLFVVNPKHHPVGMVPLSRAMRTRRPVPLTDIMEDDLRAIPVTMNQEDVAYIFRQYGLVSAPVLDDGGRLVGVITVDDVVHIIDEEAEDDIMKLGGVGETDLYSDLMDTTKARSSWLGVNLITAIVASAVIGLFEGTIDQLVALAVLMPIVASMGGNAGTQSLTVAVRAIAMKDLTDATARRFISKEFLVSAINGCLFAVLTGAVAWLWFGSVSLGVVLGVAMIINMGVAGLSGALIPLGLEKFGIDPALASSIFLTTVTDVVGFFSFLGLAAFFLL
ncbi:MAG: magnesium transporter [Pseudomonadota bacterium]